METERKKVLAVIFSRDAWLRAVLTAIFVFLTLLVLDWMIRGPRGLKEFSEEFEMLAGERRVLVIQVDDVPCVVSGNWGVKEFPFSGDPSIAEAKIYNIDGKVVESWENELIGAFFIKVEKRGTLKFEFSSGVDRSVPRRVDLNARFYPQ